MTKPTLARAFDEWLRRYNADPVGFDAEYPSDGSYGENCATYLLDVLLPETANA